MIEIGSERFRRVEVADGRGEVLLTVERLADGNTFLEARIYGRDGRLLVTIDPDGLHQVSEDAVVMLGGGPPA